MSLETPKDPSRVPANTPAPAPAQDKRSSPHYLLDGTECVRGHDGHAYIVVNVNGKLLGLRVGSRAAHQFIRSRSDAVLKRSELQEIDYLAQSFAESFGRLVHVWVRVAQFPGGVEIDLSDDQLPRVRITAAGVQEVHESETVFYRPAQMRALPRPAASGSLEQLYPYLPSDDASRGLLLAWLTYTIAHPKAQENKFVILALTGSQGSGKTLLSKLVQRVTDPSVVSVQVLPNTAKDIAIALQNAHVVFYDNLRSFPPHIADALCIAATGGVISSRQLYTDADQQLVPLHGAVVLNGLHHFIDQPDLAQRCLRIHLPEIHGDKRRSEQAMEAEFLAAYPAIMRSLYDLTAKIFAALPTAEVTHEHRMYDFARWLAAMGDVLGHHFLQEMFSRQQAEGQRDALQENVLSAAVLQFAEALEEEWSDTPSALWKALSDMVGPQVARSRDWPQNAIALSKRLTPMQVALRSQGVKLSFSRDTERKVTISGPNSREMY
jgi:hypothetical protein